jgi:hypothetical protein
VSSRKVGLDCRPLCAMSSKPTWLGRVVGYALTLVVVAVAARLVWELLRPLLPTVSGLLVAAALGYWLLRRRWR